MKAPSINPNGLIPSSEQPLISEPIGGLSILMKGFPVYLDDEPPIREAKVWVVPSKRAIEDGPMSKDAPASR